ncbi:hypothetical protein K3495_g11537 [Podosphaera aphanis]|nr:hypothetical protein K3495_g11537 [Podosphaera aphanis]
MTGSDNPDIEMADPSNPSISQLRQQQRHERTRLEPRGGAKTQESGIDENWLRNIIAEQVQSAIAPIINDLIKDQAQKGKYPSTPKSPEIPRNFNETSASRKRRKFPTWNGNKKYFNCYIKEVEDCIEIDRELMGTDRVVWCLFNASGADQNWDYRSFIEHLKRTFGNKQEREDKIALLTSMKQKESQRFADFFPKFDEALAGAGGDRWTEDSKLVWLRRALSEALKDELIPIQLDIDNYHGSVRTIEDIAYRFEQSRRFKGSREQNHPLGNLVPEPAATSHPRVDVDGDVIMNCVNSQPTPGLGRQVKGRAPAQPSIRTNGSISQTPHGDKGRLRARLVDQTEIARRKANRLCVRCGTNTHFVAECLYLPPRRPETEIRNTTFNTPPLLDNIYDVIEPEVEQEKE